jgi:cardiolipin synthase A/B
VLKQSTIFYIALSLLDIYAIARAIARRNGVEGTLAWIFAILAFPGIGAIAYLLLATPGVGRTTRRKRMTRETVRQAIAERIRLAPGILPPEEGSILNLAASLTGLLPSVGNDVELLAENEYAFERIEGALLGANRSIWAEYYIIGNDETGHRFLDLLAGKAREGVEVRLLYDAFGSLRIDGKRLAAIRAAGGRAEVFLPMNPLRRRWAVHLRNHRKMIVVDGEVGFTGGMNIANEYSGSARKSGGVSFRDTFLMLRGPSVIDLAQTFAEDWSFATGESLELPPPRLAGPDGTSVVAVVPSGPDQERNAMRLVYFAGIASARERCYLTSPYFIPDEPTIQALVSTAMRGVDVRVLVPRNCDLPLLQPAARSYYPALIRGGIRIFEYMPATLHAKALVVDGTWGIVGSANVDVRSFRLNFELGALVVDPQFARSLEERFLGDLEQSVEVRTEDILARGLPARLWEGTARLLSPLL